MQRHKRLRLQAYPCWVSCRTAQTGRRASAVMAVRAGSTQTALTCHTQSCCHSLVILRQCLLKCNVYFIVSCADNNKRLANGQRCVFYYDCGAWAHTWGYNFVVVGDNTKELYEKDGAVCDRKRLNGKDHLVPIELHLIRHQTGRYCGIIINWSAAAHTLKGLH